MKKRSLILILVGSICLILLFSMLGCPKPGPAETIELDYVTFTPSSNPAVQIFQESFIDKVNERANGELFLNYRGGPEVFAANDITDAVLSGVIDIGFNYVGAYEPIVPGVGAVMLSQLEPEEERAVGAYDALLDLHEQYGLYYIMRSAMTSGNYFYTWVKEPLSKPEELVGRLIGSATAGQPAVEAWGATWVSVSVAENYSALERGIVDGIAGQPPENIVAQGYYEVCPYGIDHPYYKSTVTLVMNLDVWNSLPQNLKDIINEVAIEAETDIKLRTDAARAEIKQELEDYGLTFLTFSPADADSYVQAAYDRAWERQQERFPEVTPHLRELLTK
jgi:TRAP-type C4-dicarboxylate transport system substrate-binding protein